MLTLADITTEVKRLLGKQVIGISTVGDLIYINDGTGKVVTVRATTDEMSLPISEFSRRILAPALEATPHVD
jgi:hypothetical protein